jgi:two-component system sensor histidine kinase MprB
MSLRAQLALFTALLVAAAVVVVSVVAYYAAQDRLISQIDDSLVSRSHMVAGGEGLPRPGPGAGGDRGPGGGRPDPYAQTDTFFQVIDKTGAVLAAPLEQQTKIPVGDSDLAVANGARGAVIHDATSDGVHLRVLASPGQSGEAVLIARSLTEVDASMRDLRNILFGVSGGGVVLAALLGLLVAHRTLRPVASLTAAAEHVASTQDLGAEIDVRRRDELGRLATSFNAMLRALRESRRQQHQLVTDASHELRTPLTSLRTNIEMLARSDDLPDAERAQMLSDATFELEELTKLVGELVDLASDARTEADDFQDVRLDQLAAAVVQRAQRRSGLRIELDATATLVVGSYGLLERATSNLVDNACKWSPPAATIEVHVGDGRLAVRDHGAGIPPEDAAHVFERFYRAETARGTPGSGLGLAIVKQIIEAHGGRSWVEAAQGGGTIAGFELAAVPLEA